MIIIKINYKKKLNPLTIESMEASMVHIHDIAGDNKGVQYKMGKEWMDFRKIFTREAVLDDSLFLRFMRTSITRNSNDFSKDFIVMKFSYDAEYRLESGEEQKMSKEELRTFYYKNGVTFQSAHTGKHGKTEPIHYKMLYRTSGKAKKGECIFVRDNLFHKAINYLTMGFYDLMEEKAKDDPDTVFKLVELSAYLSLTTACAIGYIHIPLKNILVVEDQSAYTKPMAAEIVKVANVPYENDEFVLEFDDPRMETILNNHKCTLDKDKAAEKGWSYIKERTKEELKKNGIRINGKYPGHHESIPYTVKECVVEEVEDAKIENILWDGMGLIDESIFPKYANGFVYCRSHFFKSCLFRGNVQEYFKDYCKEHEFDFETYEVTDMFGNKKKVSDIKVVITDKSLKWLKFTDMMGGTKQKAYRTYQKLMNEYENVFAVVKTAHKSKWDNLQLSTYQMNNSLPCTDEKILGEIVGQAIDFINGVKDDDKNYLKYLEMTKNQFNLNEFLVDLVNRNPEFVKTEFFRKKKKKDVYKLVDDFKKGRLPQQGDNLTIMGNPIALLMKAVGENPLEENIFDVEEDAIQCYTERFMDGENLAAFRSPHNSPNNILHFHNIKSEKISRYFPNLGENIIIINLIGTDAQARGSGFDEDSDFVFVTNQSEVVELARQAYVKYPTIINAVEEMKSSDYHFRLEDYALMDNKIADAQASIGLSTDTAQLALSYYYNEGMCSKELRECFIILSVIGQISIDLAKKEFDLDEKNEIRRIKNLPCMKGKDIPQFYADNKKSRNNKDFGKKVKILNCPMDVMAELIEKNIIGYSPRIYHEPINKFLNKALLCRKVDNRYKKQKIIDEAQKYNDAIKALECSARKDTLSDDMLYQLKSRQMKMFLQKVKNELSQETVMHLVIYAFGDENSDVRTTILNGLFHTHKELLMNCFVKNSQKI